jgi:hypothetical protein
MSRRHILLRFVVLGLLGAFLPPAIPMRAQQPTKQQAKLYDHESGFLGDEYSKLEPDAGNKDWLIQHFAPPTAEARLYPAPDNPLRPLRPPL